MYDQLFGPSTIWDTSFFTPNREITLTFFFKSLTKQIAKMNKKDGWDIWINI